MQTTDVPVERVPQNDRAYESVSDAIEPVGETEDITNTSELDAIRRTTNVKTLDDSGDRNRATQPQFGEYLTSLVRQALGSRFNVAQTIQIGTNLFADIRQSGERHRARVLQIGNDLSATLTQEGVGNKAMLLQTGSMLSAAILQSAAYAKAVVAQMGVGNIVVVTQR